MARQDLSKRNVRKLGKTGNKENPSYYVTLPVEFIRELKWRDGQRVVVSKKDNKLVVEDFEP